MAILNGTGSATLHRARSRVFRWDHGRALVAEPHWDRPTDSRLLWNSANVDSIKVTDVEDGTVVAETHGTVSGVRETVPRLGTVGHIESVRGTARERRPEERETWVQIKKLQSLAFGLRYFQFASDCRTISTTHRTRRLCCALRGIATCTCLITWFDFLFSESDSWSTVYALSRPSAVRDRRHTCLNALMPISC